MQITYYILYSKFINYYFELINKKYNKFLIINNNVPWVINLTANNKDAEYMSVMTKNSKT